MQPNPGAGVEAIAIGADEFRKQHLRLGRVIFPNGNGEPLETYIWTFSADYGNTETALNDLLARAQEHGYADRALFSIRLATEEALVNCVKHAYPEWKQYKPITLIAHFERDRLGEKARIIVMDDGVGFNPKMVPDPAENLEAEHGRGLRLISGFMDSYAVHNRYTSSNYPKIGTTVEMVKRR